MLTIASTMPKKKAENILSSCYKGAVCGISNLIDKCLLDISPVQHISVHDMLEEMGKDIVRQESKSIGMRSRLWDPEDVDKVLRYNKGTESIEGIVLDMSQIKHVLRLHPSTVGNMLNLKYLQFYSRNIDKKLLADEHDNVSLPNELRYLRWCYYPFKNLLSFNPKNLVILELSHGNMEQLWEDDDHQDLVNLRTIVLCGCNNLRKIPKLLGAINLELLDCIGCESLVELPCLNHLASLDFLHLEECRSLKKLPELPKNISYLGLSEAGIEEVHDSIEHLTRLKVLFLINTMVKNVPTCISKLESLWQLDLSNCSIAEFPETPINLRELRLRGTEIEEVPSRFACQSSLRLLDLSCTSITTADVASLLRFENLEHLKMNYCHNIELLSEVPPNLSYLEAHGCTSLEKVTFIDQNLFEVPNDIFMIFSDCFNFNKDSIDNIEETAMFKVGAQVERWISLWESGCESQSLFFCFPGNEISANKFEFQSLNSSINLKIAPNWCIGGRFLAFGICLVADLTNCGHYENIERICEYQLKAASGGNEKFKTKWSDLQWRDFESDLEFNGEHVLILFNDNMVKKDKDYEEASLELYIKGYSSWVEDRFDVIKVTKCGVHVFYVDEDQFDEMSNGESDEDQIDETSSDASDEDQEMCNIEEMSKDVSYVAEDIPDPIALRKRRKPT